MNIAPRSNYIVSKPLYEACPGIQNRQSPTMTLMSRRQVPAVNYYVSLGWINGMPEPNPHVFEHRHDFDEILLFIGGRMETPQVLGGNLEFYIGGQRISTNTTTGIFIPRGTSHGPLVWRDFSFPHLQMALMLGTGSLEEGWGKSGIAVPKDQLPRKTANFDYEQYVIRSPLRESGADNIRGRQNPTMTYMSSNQINAAKYYIEFGWIWDVVEPGILEMTHQSYDEMVLHIGGDPAAPEDLGADIEFGIDGNLAVYNTTFAAFVPRGIRHCPVNWQKVRKPHIEMAIMLGCGTLAEGWEGGSLGRPQ